MPDAESDAWPTWCPDCEHHAEVHHDGCTAGACGCDRSRDEFAAESDSGWPPTAEGARLAAIERWVLLTFQEAFIPEELADALWHRAPPTCVTPPGEGR